MNTGQPARLRARASERAYSLHGLESGRPLRVRPVLPAPTRPTARQNRWVGSVKRLARDLQAYWQRARASWARRRIEKATRVELHRLDDRALRDLGLDRSQIPSVAEAVGRCGASRMCTVRQWELTC